MRARGHDVAVATSPSLVPFLRSAGLAHVDGGEPGFDASRWHDASAVETQVHHVERAIARVQPRVVVASALALGPLLAAERAGRPVAVLGLLGPVAPSDPTQRAEVQAALDAARARLGLRPTDVERLHGDLLLTRGVPGLVDAAVHVGECGWEPPVPKVVRDWLAAVRADGARVVYVQQGRTFGAPGFAPQLALPSDVRIAASTSRTDVAWTPPPGSLVGPIVPHGAVLDQAVAAIVSGSTSVVVAALSRGVPLVVVPGGGEQFAVADVVVRAGAGCVVPARDATPARLAAALDRALALDPGPREAWRTAFARIDGPGRAAEAIEVLPSVRGREGTR